MNDWDKDNLMFLLKSPEHIIREWISQSTEDDRSYAAELIKLYALELKSESENLITEVELSKNDKEFPEAREILKKFVKNLKT